MPLFPVVPEDLDAVEVDALRELLESFKTVGASLQADLQRPVEEREHIPVEMSASELDAEMKAAVAEKKRVEDALAAREEAEATFLEGFNTDLAELGVEPEALAAADEPAPDDPDEPAPDDPDAPAEPDATPVDEPAAALAAADEPTPDEPAPEATPERRMAIPRGSSRHTPRPADAGSATTLVATRELGKLSIRESQSLDRHQFAEAAIGLARDLGKPAHVAGGERVFHRFARVDYAFPEEFTLKARDPEGNMEKLRAIAFEQLGMPTDYEAWTMEVLQAAGGICAPPTPFYTVPGFASRARPVRDALPSFGTPRGGISVPGVNTIDRSDTGVTIIEAADDAEGGTFSAKSCRTVECVEWEDTFVGIISHCLEVGNLNARTWPEGVALEEDNLMAAHAGSADTRLLDRIKSLSLNVNASQDYNALHTLLYAILRAKAAIRSALRAERDAQYTALIPEWVAELLVVDLAGQSGTDDRYVAIAAVNQFLTRQNVTPVWYKDSPTTGTPQLFGTQAENVDLESFPTVAQIGVYLNGTFLHLDGGVLELGLVRDSTLNHQNDYELFGESFENVARLGPEGNTRWINLDLCPTGQFPDLATALSCA